MAPDPTLTNAPTGTVPDSTGIVSTGTPEGPFFKGMKPEDFIDAANRIHAETRRGMEENQEATRRDMASESRHYREDVALGRVEAPELKIDERPKLEYGNWAKMAAGIFSVLALAGSKSLRTGSVGAMHAMNGALQGLHTGNMQQFNEKIAEHDAHVEKMIREHSAAMAKYHEIMNDKALTHAEKLDAIKLEAKFREDRLLMDSRSFEDFAKNLGNVGKYLTALKQVQGKQPAAKIQDLNAWKKANPKNPGESDSDYDKRARQGIATQKGGSYPLLPTRSGKKPLTQDDYNNFMKDSGNDPAKARAMAQAAGFDTSKVVK